MADNDDKKTPRFSDPERARTVPLKHSSTPKSKEGIDSREMDLFEDDRPTEEIGAFTSAKKNDDLEIDIQTEEKSLELDLPMEAEEEHGLIDATAPTTMPEMSPPPQAIAAAFEKAESAEQEDPSVSAEVPPVHVYVPEEQTGTDSDAQAPNNPLRDTGVKPLDISQFESDKPQKRDKVKIIRVESSKEEFTLKPRRRSRVGVKDVILILLIILLGVAIYFTWVVYQDYKKNQTSTPPPAKSSSEPKK